MGLGVSSHRQRRSRFKCSFNINCLFSLPLNYFHDCLWASAWAPAGSAPWPAAKPGHRRIGARRPTWLPLSLPLPLSLCLWLSPSDPLSPLLSPVSLSPCLPVFLSPSLPLFRLPLLSPSISLPRASTHSHIHTSIHSQVRTSTHINTSIRPCMRVLPIRGKILHTRNQHLINHRGFSVAFPNGLSVVFSNWLSLSQWKFTGNLQWIFSGIFQWHFTFVISGV